MKHFVNQRETIVTEAIDAELLLSGGNLVRLDGYPSIKVVVRADWHPSRGVAVISGGGSGHEPAHVGFVGDGMLTAAVAGEIFASPSVDAVLAAIVAVTGPAGCLLIVKNYTGDRLNFGLAAEKAKTLGLLVETVVVGDDIALPAATRPRGLAGTLFVHKVAGHWARAGKSLSEVRDAAEAVARSVVSLGLSLSSSTVPGQEPDTRVLPDEAELGLGIHGEPGAMRIPMAKVAELAGAVTSRLTAALTRSSERSGERDAPLAILLNDLGAVPPIEMALVSREVLRSLPIEGSLVFGPARLMTSLNMVGFSVSALPLDPALEEALTSEVGPLAWPRARRPIPNAPLPLAVTLEPDAATPSEHLARRAAVVRVCEALVELEPELNLLDAKVGDGDTGTTFALAARAILDEIDRMPFADAKALFGSLSRILSRAMGGSSGILLAILFAAMATKLAEREDLPIALEAGIERVEHHGGARLGDRTMLDALVPAARALRRGASVSEAAAIAREGADATANMAKASAGRSSYVPETALLGVADPGAVAVAKVFEVLAAPDTSGDASARL